MNLGDELVRSGAVRFGEFTLTSGKRSSYYVDVKAASSLPRLLREMARQLAKRVRDEQALAGIELGAVPILAAVALEADLPYAIVRKAGRRHGTGKRIEGQPVQGQRVLVIEDVTTTGHSVLEVVRLLRAEGATVVRVETVVDRGEGAEEALRAEGVSLGALVSSQDLLQLSAGGARR